jgi:hypothetical protein
MANFPFPGGSVKFPDASASLTPTFARAVICAKLPSDICLMADYSLMHQEAIVTLLSHILLIVATQETGIGIPPLPQTRLQQSQGQNPELVEAAIINTFNQQRQAATIARTSMNSGSYLFGSRRSRRFLSGRQTVHTPSISGY